MIEGTEKMRYRRSFGVLIGILIFYMFTACDSEPAPNPEDSTALDLGPKRDVMLPSDQNFDIPDFELDLDATLDAMTSEDYALDQGSLDSPLTEERGEGIFRLGCPRQGFAHARTLDESGELTGVAALARQGDLLLMNHHVAFVIQDPTKLSRTWWYYGGQLIDAVPLLQPLQLAWLQLDQWPEKKPRYSYLLQLQLSRLYHRHWA